MDLITQITETLSIKFEKGFLIRALHSELSPNEIKTFDQYDDLYRIRHDAVHYLICRCRGWVFGEQPISENKLLYKAHTHKYWHEVKNQSPDHIIVQGNKVTLFELTISRSHLAETEKISKYSLLYTVLMESGYDVEMDVVVITMLLNAPDRERLINVHKLDEITINSISLVVQSINELLHQVHTTDIGQEWNLRRLHIQFSDKSFGLSNDDVIRAFGKFENKPFINTEVLIDLLESKQSPEITDDDEKLLELLTNKAEKIDTILDKSDGYQFKNLYEYHDLRKTSKEKRSFLPLPFFLT